MHNNYCEAVISNEILGVGLLHERHPGVVFTTVCAASGVVSPGLVLTDADPQDP